MSNLRRQDTCSAYVLERDGIVMALFNVGHECDWTYNPEGFKRPSFHLCSHRLLYQVGRGDVVYQRDEGNSGPVHQEKKSYVDTDFQKGSYPTMVST